jgi:replicative DNA helicase
MPKRQPDTLPNNIHAEQFVLCCMLNDDKAIAKAHEGLKPSDFYRPTHSIIFKTITSLYERSLGVDPITIWEEMKRQGAPPEDCNMQYISELFLKQHILDFGMQNTEDYIRIVKDQSTLRKLLMFGRQVITMAQQRDADPEKALSAAMDGVLEMQDRKASGLVANSDILMMAWEQIDSWVKDGGRKMKMRTGIDDLDTAMMGINPGLTLIGGRPSHGKTSLCTDIIEASKDFGPFGFWSLETGNLSLAFRQMTGESRLDMQRIRSGDLDEDDLNHLGAAVSRLYPTPVYWRCGGIELPTLVAQIKAAILQHGIQAVFIDYGQIIEVPGARGIYEKCTTISYKLKHLALDHDIPVICAVQLNRQAAGREDAEDVDDSSNWPRNHEILGSGQFEQDADAIVLIYNPLALKKDGDLKNAKLILSKQKDGPLGVFDVKYSGSTLRFHPVYKGAEQ